MYIFKILLLSHFLISYICNIYSFLYSLLSVFYVFIFSSIYSTISNPYPHSYNRHTNIAVVFPRRCRTLAWILARVLPSVCRAVAWTFARTLARILSDVCRARCQEITWTFAGPIARCQPDICQTPAVCQKIAGPLSDICWGDSSDFHSD